MAPADEGTRRDVYALARQGDPHPDPEMVVPQWWLASRVARASTPPPERRGAG